MQRERLPREQRDMGSVSNEQSLAAVKSFRVAWSSPAGQQQQSILVGGGFETDDRSLPEHKIGVLPPERSHDAGSASPEVTHAGLQKGVREVGQPVEQRHLHMFSTLSLLAYLPIILLHLIRQKSC